jgi:hypothetical protein
MRQQARSGWLPITGWRPKDRNRLLFVIVVFVFVVFLPVAQSVEFKPEIWMADKSIHWNFLD